LKDFQAFNQNIKDKSAYLDLWRCIMICHDVLLITFPGQEP